MITRRQRALAAENDMREDLGDVPSLVRADFEDATIQAIEDTLVSGKLDAFRAYLRRWKREMPFPEDQYAACMHEDYSCWYVVYDLGCRLRRLGHRWEHCANQLRGHFGVLNPPPGSDFLQV